MSRSTPPAANQKTAALTITSRGASFWRCGLAFSAAPRVIPVSALTEDQVATLRAEPQLIVVDTEAEISPAA